MCILCTNVGTLHVTYILADVRLNMYLSVQKYTY